MAVADRALRTARRRHTPLRILALAPLPYLADGVPTFHGGGTVFFRQLLPTLARRGHRVTVIADAPPSRDGERRAPLPLAVPNLDVAWFAYEHRSSQRPAARGYRQRVVAQLAPHFARAARSLDPDVVLIGRDILLPYVLPLCRRHGFPTLVIAHGPAVAGLRSGRYPAAFARQLVDGFRSVDAIVAVARHIAADLARLGANRVTTIPNVVDPRRFRPGAPDRRLARTLGIATGAPVVAHVSVLRPWKRPLDLADSAARVLRAEPRCVYLVVGDGPSRAAVEARVRRHGIGASFRFAGEVAHADVARYLRLADVVVQPSEREGLSLVYREAQACGRAVLASDIPAAREAIVPGKTGLLFPAGDVRALAAGTLRLLRDRSTRVRLGAAGRAVARRETIARWASAYAGALRAAAATGRDRGASR